MSFPVVPSAATIDTEKLAATFAGRHFLTLKDFSSEEILSLLDLSVALKLRKRTKQAMGERGDSLGGRNFVLLFEKDSTRTRCAFEVAIADEGGHSTFLSGGHMGKKESIADTARVLGRMYDGIEFRGFQHTSVEALAKWAGVPVWNGLTDEFHPTQILADLLTVRELLGSKKATWQEVRFVYVGDGRNNMANSLMIGCAKLGLQFAILAPPDLRPEEPLRSEMAALAATNGGSVAFFDISEKAACMAGADVVYTDVWVSMGEEAEMEARVAALRDYQVNSELMGLCQNPDAIFLHCLPAFHDALTKVGRDCAERFDLPAGLEVTDEVFESPNSAVFQQAENRLHTIKAIMCATAGHFKEQQLQLAVGRTGSNSTAATAD